MKAGVRLRSWLRASFRRSRTESDMDRELRLWSAMPKTCCVPDFRTKKRGGVRGLSLAPWKARKALFAQLAEQIDAIPGVQSSTLSEVVLVANSTSTTRFRTPGRGARPGDADKASINDVGGLFFETMGIPILRGRSLSARDRGNGPRVAVVNQQFVRNFFPDGEALGNAIVNGGETYQILGICGDAKSKDIRTAIPPTFYRAFLQAKDLSSMTF